MINYILVCIFTFFILSLAGNKVSFRRPVPKDVVRSAAKSRSVHIIVKYNSILRLASFVIICLNLCILISLNSWCSIYWISVLILLVAMVIYSACIGWEMYLER